MGVQVDRHSVRLAVASEDPVAELSGVVRVRLDVTVAAGGSRAAQSKQVARGPGSSVAALEPVMDVCRRSLADSFDADLAASP